MDGGATAMLIMAAVTAATAKMSADAGRASAKETARFQRKAADNQAKMMEYNAAEQSKAAREEKLKNDLALEAQEREARIRQATANSMAGASGLAIPGTTMERLLSQQEEQDKKRLDFFDMQGDQEVAHMLQGASNLFAHAQNTRAMGIASADLGYANAKREIQANENAGYLKAAGYVGGAAVKQFSGSPMSEGPNYGKHYADNDGFGGYEH